MNEQYHSKFETVRTQMLNQKNKFLLFFSLLSHICLSPVCLYLPLNSSLSSLPISASLSLSHSLPLSQAANLCPQPIQPWFLLCLKPLILPRFLLLSICLLTLISLPLKFGHRKRKGTKYNVIILPSYGYIFLKTVELTCDWC